MECHLSAYAFNTSIYTLISLKYQMQEPNNCPSPLCTENSMLLIVPSSTNESDQCTEEQLEEHCNITEEIETSRYQHFQQISVCILWCIAAVIMTVLNKIILELVPVASAVLLVQIASCVIIFKVFNRDLVIHPSTMWELLPYGILFYLNLCTSMQAISHLSIPTFNVFRNMQCFISCPLDYAVRREYVSYSSFCAMLVVLSGSVVYCAHNVTVDAKGCAWASVNVVGNCVYAIYVKTKFVNISATEMAWYNNITSLVPIILMVLYDSIYHLESRESLSKCFQSSTCSGFLALSSVGCFVISVTTFHSQKILSPVTWLLLNNLNKIPSTVMACAIWNIPLGLLEVAGLVISLIGGLMYSLIKI